MRQELRAHIEAGQPYCPHCAQADQDVSNNLVCKEVQVLLSKQLLLSPLPPMLSVLCHSHAMLSSTLFSGVRLGLTGCSPS